MNITLEKYGIDHIWHFTDRSNLELIKKFKGLLSLCELERREIAIPVPGGNKWSHDADKVKGMDKYVHLAFVKDHPMLYIAQQDGRITNPVWIKIDSSILLNKGMKYCTDVSNKSDVAILNNKDAIEKIDFQVLFTRMNWKDPEINKRRQAAIKSEILVPDFVSIKNIIGYKNG